MHFITPLISRPTAIAIAALLMVLHSSTVLSQDINAMKAAYIFNFSKFVTWQQQIDNQIVVCVDTSNSALVHQLQGLEGKAVADKNIHIRKFDSSIKDEIANHCHILYSDSDTDSLALALDSVLVVTDSVEPESIIIFQVSDRKLSFEINAARADANNIYISSKLLQLAGKVYR